MSETNGVDDSKAQHDIEQERPDQGAAPEAEQPNPAASFDQPIPEHLTDAALDGHQIKKLAEERIAEMQAELDAAKDQALRLAAELENTRRRADRERQEAAKYGITSFARDLLSVADNMAKAIELAPEDPSTMSAEGLKGLIGGMRMTEKELLSVFERHGVRKIDPKGERFDPNVHQAIAQVPGGGLPKDHVADVAAPGFVIGDRLVRAAMVTVSTGAEVQATPETDGEGEA
jgi:molecular chaperone GrpE